MLEIKKIIPPTGEDFEKALKELYEINDIPYEETDSFWEVGNGENANFYISDDDIELLASSIKEEDKAHALENIKVVMEIAAGSAVWVMISENIPYGKGIVYTINDDIYSGKIEINYYDVMRMLEYNEASMDRKTFKKELLCLPYAYKIFEEG